ncbi:hypothetical protein NEPAR06_0870 [Nematocida parisii]|nr:uncharacterized protein NEPG_02329 [Nematocida parisii ERTm1]EIJ92930.1 hypothetical protein NEPG_02329 [Nematocida parisii ERTm1]KAI5144039.1 hypothetical protein NEPAR07_1016 [Nematocida parisii]KAI5154093.1 hypothetical protein NEPAR06_0870 [Nematocida parisii]KAI5157549.1 hypothetical protein NEPAR05_1376 [Nematocida parisii]|eukprot:XP_013060156.1 hypothetical protein NEPG_02329 [Nematocida parisii ERTm1]
MRYIKEAILCTLALFLCKCSVEETEESPFYGRHTSDDSTVNESCISNECSFDIATISYDRRASTISDILNTINSLNESSMAECEATFPEENRSITRNSSFTLSCVAASKYKKIDEKLIRDFNNNCMALKFFSKDQIDDILKNWESIHAKYLEIISNVDDPLIELIHDIETNSEIIASNDCNEKTTEIEEYIKKIEGIFGSQNIIEEDRKGLYECLNALKNVGEENIKLVFKNSNDRMRGLHKIVDSAKNAIKDEFNKIYFQSCFKLKKKKVYFQKNKDKKEIIWRIVDLMNIIVRLAEKIQNGILEPSKSLISDLAKHGMNADNDMQIGSSSLKDCIKTIESILFAATPGFITIELTSKMKMFVRDEMLSIKNKHNNNPNMICKLIISVVCKSLLNHFIAESSSSRDVFLFGCNLKANFSAIQAGIKFYHILENIELRSKNVKQSSLRASKRRTVTSYFTSLFDRKNGSITEQIKSAENDLKHALMESSRELENKKPPSKNNVFMYLGNIDYFEQPFDNESKYNRLISEVFSYIDYEMDSLNNTFKMKNDTSHNINALAIYTVLFYRIMTLASIENILIDMNFMAVSKYALRIVANQSDEQKYIMNFLLNPDSILSFE